ncbi:hypothetical protein AYK81_28740 [Bacillus thuringiensis]|nr:hypothetical protein AYK81_28740 [Bacillus thuringiensis]
MELNYMEELFRKYVNLNLEQYEKKDLASICDRHQIKYTQEIVGLDSILLEKFKKLIGENESFSKDNLNSLRRQLLLKHFVESEPLEPYFGILETLITYLPNEIKIKPLDKENEWKEIIKTVIDYSIVCGERKHELKYYNREYNEGMAAKNLQEREFIFKVNNGSIEMDDETHLRIALEIEKKVAQIGGWNVAEYVLNKIYFEKKIQRYKINREKSATPKYIEPQLPVGYLLNISAKHFAKHNHKDRALFQKDIDDLLLMTKSYVSVLSLQSYSIYDDFYIQGEGFVDYIHKNILFDKIISIKQFNPIFVPKIIKGMLSPFFEEKSVQAEFKLTLEQVCDVVDFLLNNLNVKQSFSSFKLEEIKNVFPLLEIKHIKKLLDILSHKGKINNDFIHPTSLSDFEKKPLIQRKKGEYILVDRALCAISFYDAICDKLRKIVGRKFDAFLGIQLEEFIKSLLSEKGVVVKSGFYDDEECDLIIETNSKIVFMEVKKKPLTRKASAGDGVALFKDITKGLLSSQIQLGKHESKLLREQRMELRKVKKKKKAKEYPIEIIELNNRDIERVSVNAWDYGIVNDKLVTQNLLQFLTILELRAMKSDEDEELEELRKSSKILIKQFEELKKISIAKKRENLRENYFDSSFISLQQLMMIINDSNSTESFVENLFINKHLITGEGDPFFEYAYCRKLKSGQ